MKAGIAAVALGALAVALFVQRNRARLACQRAVRDSSLREGMSGAAAVAFGRSTCGRTWRL